jgi:hypothetical protein
MRRGLLPLVAALVALTGCHGYWGTSSSSSTSGSTTVYGPTEAEAVSAVRNAVPAAEAYGADHDGSYEGLTVEILRSYDGAIGDVSVGDASRTRYCIESSAEGITVSFTGPGGELLPIACGSAPLRANNAPVAPPSYEAPTNLRIAVPAIEAYYADNGTFAGMTLTKLRSLYDYGIPDVKIVGARKRTYCIESSAEGETWSYRPSTGVVRGNCG